MDTVADTHKTNEENRGLKLPHRKAKLRQHFIREARRMRTSRMDYYAEPDLFDYARENAAEMEGLFNWLNTHNLNTERIQKACVYYLIHADESEREKEKLGNDLNNLISFKTGLTSSGRIIAEKAFYYASVLEELDEVKLYRESKAQRN